MGLFQHCCKEQILSLAEGSISLEIVIYTNRSTPTLTAISENMTLVAQLQLLDALLIVTHKRIDLMRCNAPI